jgi:adenylate cyclase
MYTIYSKTDDLAISASEGSTILRATLSAGIRHTHVCGGNARCSTCRVYILEGLENRLPRNEKKQQIAHKLGFPEQIRLACQTKIRGDITIKRAVIDELDIEIILKQIGDETGKYFGKEIEIAALFFDIENYTVFAETHPAYDVVHVLNRYYQTMNKIIEDHDGVISDVAGDGILALFGALRKKPNNTWDAVCAVREMQIALIRFNDYLEKMYGQSFRARAGISFGKAIIGNFDTGQMSKISAIGDIVNLASRVEAANKDLGTSLLLSESAMKQISGKVIRHIIHRARLKGKSGIFRVYEIEL